MFQGTKWSTIIPYNYTNSRSLFCAALVYAEHGVRRALEEGTTKRAPTTAGPGIPVPKDGRDPGYSCVLHDKQAELQSADHKQTKKRRAQAARHSRDDQIARQGH